MGTGEVPVMMKSAFHGQHELTLPLLEVKTPAKRKSTECPTSLHSSVTPFLFKYLSFFLEVYRSVSGKKSTRY